MDRDKVSTQVGRLEVVEPCAVIREDVGEASAGGRAGQPLSRDRKQIPGADAVCVAEGNMLKSVIARAWERMTKLVADWLPGPAPRQQGAANYLHPHRPRLDEALLRDCRRIRYPC
jgi:hypothetical protein